MRAQLRNVKTKVITVDEVDHHCVPTKHRGYYATTLGHVISTKRGIPIVLQPWATWNGYLQIRIARKNLRLHRVIAAAFLEKPGDDKDGQERLEVNHIDGSKTNNKVANIEWNSGAENRLHHQTFKGLFT